MERARAHGYGVALLDAERRGRRQATLTIDPPVDCIKRAPVARPNRAQLIARSAFQPTCRDECR